MLTIPPSARPYSAPNPLFTTRNSCTDSCGGVDLWDPVTVFTLSAPSTVISLLRSRIPPKETRVDSNSVIVDCKLVRPVATPAVSRAKSVNSRPLIGRSSICFVSITWLISVLVGSIVGASVLTITSSPCASTFNVILTVAVCPTLSMVPVWVYFEKPLNSAFSS